MLYENNEMLALELKIFLKRANVSHTEVADRLGMSRQNFNKIFSKKNITFSDAQKIANAAGYELQFDFVKTEKEHK